jgi:hypothetical protein
MAASSRNITFGACVYYDNLSKGGSDKGDYNNLALDLTLITNLTMK